MTEVPFLLMLYVTLMWFTCYFLKDFKGTFYYMVRMHILTVSISGTVIILLEFWRVING